MKKTTALLLAILLFVSLFVGLYGCEKDGGSGISGGDTAEVTDGNWLMTGEWQIARAESGDETLSVSAKGDSTAWNTFFNLADDWTVSADMNLTGTEEQPSCTRLVFGDEYGNVVFAATVDYAGGSEITVRADEFISSGWRNVFENREPITVDPTLPVNLMVQRKSGGKKLTITCTQNDTELTSGSTRTLQDRLSSMLTRPGLNVYQTETSFSNFAVSAKRRSVVVSEDETIVAGENVPTDEWILGENAVHNLLNGASALILDGEGEVHAWNAVNELGDAWTLTFITEFGTSYRDSVCSRYMFGREAADDAEYIGLITVNFSHNQVMLQMEDKQGGAWVTTGGEFNWKNISGRKVKIQIVKYPGINRLAVLVYDGDRLVIQEFSDEMTEQQMEKYKHYGVMTYSSQCRFSGFECTDTADESVMPEIKERVYNKVDEITVGKGETTSDWRLSRNSTYFHENGKECMVIDSKGDEFSYYVKHGLGDSWEIDTDVEFGTYYSATAGARVAFTTTDSKLVALLTLKYSANDANINLNLQTMTDDLWTDVIKLGWTKGESKLHFNITGDKSGKIHIVISSTANGTVFFDNEATFSQDVVSRMKVAALATTSTQVKYSDIHMNLTGAAVSMTGGSTGGGDGVLYKMSYGTASTNTPWDTGSGMTYYTNNSLIVTSTDNKYSYNRNVEVADGFSLSTDVLFGSFDSKGLCTARIAMVDKYNGMAGLVTVKFSENFEIMVEGQYNSHNTWYNCISNNSWRAVASNKIHVTLSRKDGSNSCWLSIRDSAGSTVFSASLNMPADAAKKICYIGLGVDKSTVQFSNMSLSATKVQGGNQNTYDMVEIKETGKALDKSEDWTTPTGVTVYDDGSLILDSNAGLYSNRLGIMLQDAFTISTKIQFGRLDSKGLSTARLGIINSSGSLLTLFTMKYSQNTEVLVEGEYNKDGWTKIITDNAWRKVADNIITATVTKEAGANKLHFVLKDSTGKVFYDVMTAEIPADILAAYNSFAVGCSDTKVKFCDVQTDAKKDETEIEEIEIGELAESTEWTTDNGAIYSVDESGNGSLILYKSGAEASSANTTALTENFSFDTDVIFGTADSSGNVNARIYLTDATGKKLVRYFLTYNAKHELQITATYNGGSQWETFAAAGPITLTANRIVLHLTKSADGLKLTVCDKSGAELTVLNGTTIPTDLLPQVTGLSVGTSSSRAQFLKMKLTVAEPEPQPTEPDPTEQEEPTEGENP